MAAMIQRPVDRLISRGIVVVFLLIFFALALDTAGRKAITTDEPLHLTHAIAMHQTGVMPIPEMHTPLTYRLISGLLGTEPPLPDITTLDTWPGQNPYAISRELLWRTDIHIDRIVWLGRFVVIGMGVILGALMGAWTLSLTRGNLPATGSLMLLYALSPNLLASAALATTDIAATLTWFLSIFTWWRYWQRPSWGRWLLAAISLGLALAAKLTGILLLPITFALALLYLRQAARWWRPLLIWAGMLPVAALVLWALYGFEIAGVVPMPAYVEAWSLLWHEVDASHANYFWGSVTSVGSWFYLPATLLLKTPLLQLVLFLLIPFVLWWERYRWHSLLFLLLPAGFFLLVAAASRLNYGYRHALPAVPYLMVLSALGIPRLWARPIPRVALVVGLGWTALAALLIHPDHLTYFNELASGRGYRYLGDSNLDWGQDLNQLADYAARYQAETGKPLYFSYTGTVQREHYGLIGPSLVEQFNQGDNTFSPANPPAGRYAINTGDLQGTGLILGELRESALFDWFRHRELLTMLGSSIFVYDVARQAEGSWIAHCLSPGPLLADPEAEQLVGRTGLRHIRFDCNASWVFPENGAPGWYVLPLDAPLWINDRLKEPVTEIVYRHQANAYGPDYAIAYWPGSSPGPLFSDEIHRYTAAASGPAALRAFGTRGREWLTIWQANEATAEPLSIQAHLISDSEAQVADGLGFSADQWLASDWFAQRHTFTTSGDTLETGLYNYLTLESVGAAIRLTAP